MGVSYFRDSDYNHYMVDRAILSDVLPMSDTAYSLLTKIFSPRPERRPSLATIREEVLAMDTFFLTDEEAAKSGWAKRVAKKLQWCAEPSQCHQVVPTRPPPHHATLARRVRFLRRAIHAGHHLLHSSRFHWSRARYQPHLLLRQWRFSIAYRRCLVVLNRDCAIPWTLEMLDGQFTYDTIRYYIYSLQ
ncbi:hypothetical protein F5148DRAFT_1227753 [Russula earlei]|uniref:Uncharacterized protein n=1 Tax=Russula earlei TaxID=71964 RepID=A0ACC0U0G3_9AGAM|nr:hypothetical protein F5148DRAFT_1227753 [Russula earlei]